MPIAVSFFVGAGGLDIGMERAGFEIKLSVELEPTYCKTYRLNHSHANIREGNIMEYNRNKIYDEANLEDIDDIDLIFGGSPCQSFSTAGKRLAFDDHRGQAMLKFADIVSEVQPKFFILENVRGLLSAALKHRPINQRGDGFPPLEPEEQPGSALAYLLSRFNNYNVIYKLLNAADYGVPQTRERVFVVGVRSNLGIDFQFPEPTHTKNGDYFLPKWVTVRDVLQNLKDQEHHYVDYSPERLRYMQMIPLGGGNWRNLPAEAIVAAMGGAYKSGGGKVGFFRRVSIDKPCPTLLTSPIQKSTNLGHPYEDRPLSIEEYLAIQEFPVGYQVAGNLNEQYIQIGNAVPIRLAEKMGRAVAALLAAPQPV